MARSHPPTLIKRVERALREECEVRRGERLLVAVSGGGDSQALLSVLSRLRAKLGFSLVAHGVDHGLRSEARSELDLAEALAADLEVPFERSRLRVSAGGNLQARARDARYRALERAAKRRAADWVVTAHHADDRAETLLIRLLSGSGPDGLAVLPPRVDRRLRPMLRARRADVAAHLTRHQIPCAHDPSNEDRRFLRVRVRRELLPLLEELSPGVVAHLNDLADELLEHRALQVTDAEGRRLPLGRAQMREIRRALKLRSSATVRLGGGYEIRVSPESVAHALRASRRPGAARRR